MSGGEKCWFAVDDVVVVVAVFVVVVVVVCSMGCESARM